MHHRSPIARLEITLLRARAGVALRNVRGSNWLGATTRVPTTRVPTIETGSIRTLCATGSPRVRTAG